MKVDKKPLFTSYNKHEKLNNSQMGLLLFLAKIYTELNE